MVYILFVWEKGNERRDWKGKKGKEKLAVVACCRVLTELM